MSVEAFTVAAPTESVGARASRSRVGLVVVALVVALVAAIALTQRPSDFATLSTNNTAENGARAVAQILRAQGVEVTQVGSLARASIANPEDTTLVIADAQWLTAPQARSIAAYEGPVVWLGASDEGLSEFAPDLGVSWELLTETVPANCDNVDALAAEEITVSEVGLIETGPSGAELCFGQRNDVFGYASFQVDGAARVIIPDEFLLTNASLVENGNAALGLRAMGTQPNVVWVVADFLDPTLLGDQGAGGDTYVSPDFLPPGFGSALFALMLAALVLAYWKARRFGPLVREPLPVVVRASEVTRGRARLYRRARAYGRATAALRAHTARSVGRRLGVPASSPPDALTDAISTATGMPATEVTRILYGPVPTNSADMTAIVHELDRLESEVHGP